MEEYINDNTIIKDSVYETFKDQIHCEICNKIMIDPVICLTCQTKYCRKCIEKKIKENGTCTNNCQNPMIKDVVESNNYIKKFKFRCFKCFEEIKFDDIKNHSKSDCEKRKMTEVSNSTIKNYKNKTNEQIPNLNSN